MDFSKTYYKSKNHKKNIQLELSKTAFGHFNYNKKLKNSFFYGNFNSFSTDNPNKTPSQNIITNKMLKTITKFRSSKSSKDKIINQNLQHFHTQAIKLKIRKNKKFKSLFDKIDISSPSNNMFQSPKLKQMQKNLINLKLKSNKNKIFDHIFDNNRNSMNLNYSEKIQKDNNKFNNNKLLTDDISKTHFTTTYYPSFANNKSENKSITNSINNKNNMNNKKYEISNYNINNNIKNNSESNKILLKTETDNSPNTNNILYKFIKTDNNININTIHSLNNTNNLNTFSSTPESFITSINYIQAPPYPVEFREQNLINFYAKTRDLRYIKYFVHLKKLKLENEKEKKEYIHFLHDNNMLKYIHFYKLFKPYNYSLEKYLFFLKEKIILENKENQKLTLIKNDLFTEVVKKRRILLQIHKRLKLYLNDKFFLLCVKNSNLNMDFFEEKDKLEFMQDLKNFEILKNYINELSELSLNASFLKQAKKSSIINNYANNKKTTIIGNIARHYSRKKTTNIGRKNTDKYLNIFKNSRIRFKPRPIFESVSQFNEYMKNSRKKIENLLMEDNKIGIEVANLRDYYLLHKEEIKKINYNSLLLNKECNLYNQKISNVKFYNSQLIMYKNSLMKKRRKKNDLKIMKKITEIINGIYEYNIEEINSLINKRNKGKTLLELKDLENVIIFLVNYNTEQKNNNLKVYNEELKKIEKNKRIAIIKQKKEEDEKIIKKKWQELLEKEKKIININNRPINIKYKPPKKRKKKENFDEEKDSVDISY